MHLSPLVSDFEQICIIAATAYIRIVQLLINMKWEAECECDTRPESDMAPAASGSCFQNSIYCIYHVFLQDKEGKTGG